MCLFPLKMDYPNISVAPVRVKWRRSSASFRPYGSKLGRALKRSCRLLPESVPRTPVARQAFLTRCHHTAIFDDTEMKRAYTKQLYEHIYKQTQIKPDPQVFLGMAARTQTVDTRLFFYFSNGLGTRLISKETIFQQ